MQARPANLKNKQTAKVKKNRIDHKVAHVEEQQKRKQWAKRQRIIHQYAVEDSDSDDEIGNKTLPTIEGQQLEDNAVLVLSEHSQQAASTKGKDKAAGSTKKPCKCGSTTHCRTSFRDCPLHKWQLHNYDSLYIIVGFTHCSAFPTANNWIHGI